MVQDLGDGADQVDLNPVLRNVALSLLLFKIEDIICCNAIKRGDEGLD